MPALLYTGTLPALLPGKTESVSRNGLKKTSGRILCLESEISAASPLMASFGSVFPSPPPMRNLEPGLVEIAFDAYQQTGDANRVLGSELVTLEKNFGAYSLREQWLVDTVTVFTNSVATNNSSLLPFAAAGTNLVRTLKRRFVIGTLPTTGPVVSQLTISWITEPSSIARRNFGQYDELDIVYSQSPTVQ